MSTEKKNNSEDDQNKAEEPEAVFKSIRIFDSFEEEEEYTAKQRAAMSHDERLEHIEELRKRVFNQHLLPDGTWPSLSKTFKIMNPYTGGAGK